MDINLGCPQQIAKRGLYGSFLLENEDLVIKILSYLSNNLKCAVTCKIRLFPDLNRTIALVKRIEQSGVKVLTVHGRTKEENKHLVRECNWDAIKLIKQTISLPLIGNGGVENFNDVENFLTYTGCDAVMSAEKLLEYPPLFDHTKKTYNLDSVSLEYLDICEKYDQIKVGIRVTSQRS